MLNLLIKDFKDLIHLKKIITALLSLLLVYGVFSLLFNNFMEEKRLLDKVHVGIVDRENSLLSGMLVDNFQNNDQFTSLFTLHLETEETLLKKYHQNDLSAIVYIPEAFTDSLFRYENKPIHMILNPNFPLENKILENIMASYSTYIQSVDTATYALYTSLKANGVDQENLDAINKSFSINMVLTALNRNHLFDAQIIDTFPSSSSSDYFLSAIALIGIMFTASSSASLLNDEVQARTLSRYRLTGQSLNKFIWSKLLVMSLKTTLMTLPLLLWLALSSDHGLTTFFLMLMIVLLTSALSLLIGSLLIRQGLNMLLTTLMVLILGIVGGNFIPIQLMPKFLQNLAAFTPNFWFLRILLINKPVAMFRLAIGLFLVSSVTVYLIKVKLSRGNYE